MGIDWETLLGAEGEELQNAYDEMIDESWVGEPFDDFEDVPEPDDGEGQAAVNTCTAGEIALVSSGLFQAHELRMYRYICINNQCVEYLIGSEVVSILGVNLVDAERPTFQEGGVNRLPVLQYPREYMKRGQIRELLYTLSGLLQKPFWNNLSGVDVTAIPMKHHARMAKLRMIRRKEDHIWTPTGYGLSLGVVDGYLPSNGGRPCHTLFVLSGYKDGLDRALSWSQHPPVPFRPELSWAETLKRAGQGLPRSDGHAAGIVRDFASMPLSDYMASNKDKLELLRREFGELSTYQEAADRIFRLCMDCDGTLEASNHCMDLIFALSIPIFQALKTVPRPTY